MQKTVIHSTKNARVISDYDAFNLAEYFVWSGDVLEASNYSLVKAAELLSKEHGIPVEHIVEGENLGILDYIPDNEVFDHIFSRLLDMDITLCLGDLGK